MNHSEVFANTKRSTRSQLTLPELNFDFGRSPLKDARTARKHNVSHPDDIQPLDYGNSEVKTPTDRTPPKRPMSPSRGVAEEDERESKRVKRSENTSPITERHSAEPTWHSPSRKPVSTTSYTTHEEVPRTPNTWRRAQSVPPQSTTPKAVPHIDFSRMSPSPWKSPSKARLRVASVPSMDSILDTKESTVDSSSSIPQIEVLVNVQPPTPDTQKQRTQDEMQMEMDPSPSNESTLIEIPPAILDDQTTKSSPKLPAVETCIPQTESEVEPTPVQDLDIPMVSSPITSPPPSSLPLPTSSQLLPPEFVPPSPNTPQPQAPNSDPFIRPSSPLSPLPSTYSLPSTDTEPSVPSTEEKELRRSRRRSNTLDQAPDAVRDSVDTLTTNVHRPGSVASSITSSTSTSRLPRPASATSSYKSTSTHDGEEIKIGRPPPRAQQSRARGMKPKGGSTPTGPKNATVLGPGPSTSKLTMKSLHAQVPVPVPAVPTTLAPAPAPPTVVPTKAATSNVNVAPTKPSAPAPTKATTAGKAPVKAPASRPTTGTTPIPLGGRMTRSAALRAQKREETSAGNSPANSKASARPIARANSSMCCSLFRMAYEFGFINL